MNVSICHRGPALIGFVVGILLAVVGFGRFELSGAQLTFGDSGPLLPTVTLNDRTDIPWPALEWGLRVTLEEPYLSMELLSGASPILPPLEDLSRALPPVAALPAPPAANTSSVKKAEAESPLSEIAASPTDEKPPAVEGKATPPKWSTQHLGDSNFNQAAESLNVHKGIDGKADDLSRQFGGVTNNTSKDVVTSSPITGWAILILVALVAFAALALGQFENDKDDRDRRKNSRHHRRRHHRAE